MGQSSSTPAKRGREEPPPAAPSRAELLGARDAAQAALTASQAALAASQAALASRDAALAERDAALAAPGVKLAARSRAQLREARLANGRGLSLDEVLAYVACEGHVQGVNFAFGVSRAAYFTEKAFCWNSGVFGAGQSILIPSE